MREREREKVCLCVHMSVEVIWSIILEVIFGFSLLGFKANPTHEIMEVV